MNLKYKDLKPKEYILEPLIFECDLTMIYAVRWIGRTMVALGIAWAISTGSEFLGWKAKEPKKVLYIDGEMPLVTIRERIQLIIGNNDIDNENFSIEVMRHYSQRLIYA